MALVRRDEWLRAGLSTQPADRPAAEDTITGLYRLAGQPPPDFHWVTSPAAAVIFSAGGRDCFRPSQLRYDTLSQDTTPVAVRIADRVARLRDRLTSRRARRPETSWLPAVTVAARTTSAEDALASGTPLDTVLEAAVYHSLRATLNDGIAAPLRMALREAAQDSLGLAWYGQHEAHWVAYYDALKEAGLLRMRRPDEHELGLWAALARSAGWWWPYDGLCVLAERPCSLHAEPVPGSRHGELRPHRDDGLAIGFADGHGVHALHGTPVPDWVIAGPSVKQIHQEPNIEVRRIAIERLGWDAYVDQAELELIATAADPGNPGHELRLYHVPGQVWGGPARVLLVVNGSAERDGRRRRYGLSVPHTISDPVAAAGWSYGLSGPQYAQLMRRT